MTRFNRIMFLMFSVGALIAATTPVFAGTLVETHLSGIRAVDLRLLLGSLQNRPDLEVEVDSLQESLADLAQKALEENGLEVSAEAKERLLLTVELDRLSSSDDWEALLVAVELLERAALLRHRDSLTERECWVTSWRELQVKAVKTSELAHEAEELVRTSVEEFAERVRAANAYKLGTKREDGGANPSGSEKTLDKNLHPSAESVDSASTRLAPGP